jgi:hypothetical protein
MSLQFDQDRIIKRIKESLGKIYTEADPAVLDQYRKLIKKEVSFFKRSYLAAYFLMELDQQGGGKRHAAGRNGRLRGNPAGGHKYESGPAAAGEGQKSERGNYPLADEESVKLFFSAGRSRKVFPREILGLVFSKTSVAKENIGAIRILDNYSFVQVRNTVADEIINNLNGCMFRGKPLVVNFARARPDDEQFPDGEDRRDGEKPDYKSDPGFGDDAFREHDSDGADGESGELSAEDSSDEDENGDTKGI